VTVLATSPPVAAGWRTWVRFGLLSFGSMLDVALLVLGSGLGGLAVAVTLGGLDLANLDLGISTGALLASGLGLAVLAAFCFGVYGEGPVNRGVQVEGFPEWQIAVARAVSAVAIGLFISWAASALMPYAADLSVVMTTAVDFMAAAGRAGWTVVPLLGVAAAYAIRGWEAGRRLDIPVMYFICVVATMLFMT
jgi:hypothetical protein